MAPTSTRISDVHYDAASRSYHGAVIFDGPEGVRRMRVSAPGQPGWTYERALDALSSAGKRAQGGV